VPASSPHTPEEVLILIRASLEKLPVRCDNFHRENIVASQPIFAVEPPDAPAEGEPCNTGVRNDSEWCRQPMCLRCPVKFPQPQPGLSACPAVLWVDMDFFHE